MNHNVNMAILANCMPVIKYGSEGEIVRALQMILAKYGWYAGEPNGVADGETVKGIKLLQIALGLEDDGVWNAVGWAKLFAG